MCVICVRECVGGVGGWVQVCVHSSSMCVLVCAEECIVKAGPPASKCLRTSPLTANIRTLARYAYTYKVCFANQDVV